MASQVQIPFEGVILQEHSAPISCPTPNFAKGSNEFLRYQAAAGTMALKLQRFTVTLCAHRFCSKNLVNFLFKKLLTDSENRCVVLLVRNPGSNAFLNDPCFRMRLPAKAGRRHL